MYTLVGIVLVLGIAVICHELGHFIVARRCGVRVEEFCIGFPPRIFSITRGDTKYSLGIVPVGGFVKMAGEEPDAIEGQPDEFHSQSIPKRMAIALAGPMANMVIAYICIFIYLVSGGLKLSPLPIFGTVKDNSAYEAAGVMPFDQVVTVNNAKPETLFDAIKILDAAKPGENVKMEVLRGGNVVNLMMTANVADSLARSSTLYQKPIVGKAFSGDPASKAGIKSGDLIESIDGKPIRDWSEMHDVIFNNAGETPVLIGIVRNNNEKHLIPVTPSLKRMPDLSGNTVKFGRIGIEPPSEAVSFTLKEAFIESFVIEKEFIMMIFKVLGMLFSGDLSVKALAGPVGIATVAGDSVKQGPHQFLKFLALINANLGFVNLIPLLLITDGGLIFLFLIEAIRRRKMSLKGMLWWQQIGVAQVLLLLVVVTWNDVVERLGVGEMFTNLMGKLFG